MFRQTCLFLLPLSVAAALSAETPRWTRATPFGSEVVALTQAASVPRTLYSATADGRVYASADGGATWLPRTPPLAAGETVLDAVADPLDARTVYLRTSAGLLRSADGGASWARAGAGLPAGRTVVPNPGQPGVLWAATGQGLYRSADRGDTWQHVEHSNVAAVAIDPLDPGILFAAVKGDPLYSPLRIVRSTDHGATWEATAELLLLTGGLPGEPGFAFDAAHPGLLYVFLQNGSWEALYRTADLGATWTVLTLNAGINDLASSPDGTLFAATDLGLSKSTDQGTTWTPPLPLSSVAAPQDRLVRILASAALPNPLLAAGNAGLWSSADGGASWRASNQGIVAPGALPVLAAPAGAPALTTAAGNAVYRSVDRGATWTPLHTRRQGVHPQRLAALHPRRPRTIYGIAANGRTETLVKSVDGGRTWGAIELLFSCRPDNGTGCTMAIHAVTLDPRRPETVYAAGLLTQPEGTEPFLIRSDDGFQTYPSPPPLEGSPRLTGLTADPHRSGTLYGLSCQGFHKSTDAGVSWQKTARNLPANVCATALALDPRDTRKIWLGTAGKGLYFSPDGGKTFQSLSRGLEAGRIGTLLFDPEDPTRLYAGAAGKGVYRWNATRRQWAPLPHPGLPTAGYTGSLTLDPQAPGVLYAAHPKRGIFRLDLEE